MHKRVQKVLLCCLLAVCGFQALAGQTLTSQQLIDKAEAFVAAKNARQQPQATEADVDKFLSLLADTFIDEHVKHAFSYTDKNRLRADMVSKLKDEVIHSSIAIEQMMVGSNVVFVKMTEVGKVKPVHLGKVIEYHHTNILSLEFDETGLIKHIRRHHG